MNNFHIINFCELFSENAFCLSCRLRIPVDKYFIPVSGHIYIIFGAHTQSYELLMIQHDMNDVRYIIINSQHPVSEFNENKYYISLAKNNMVWNNGEMPIDSLDKFGIRVHSIYIFEFSYQPCERKRDIDIMFIGPYTIRRYAIYNLLVKNYPSKKIVFHFNFNIEDLDGITKELQRTKYYIIIPSHNLNIYDSHSIHRALACECDVVSLFSEFNHMSNVYEKFIYFCKDFIDFFNAINTSSNSVEQKLKYPQLIKEMVRYLEDNHSVIKQLVNKKNNQEIETI